MALDSRWKTLLRDIDNKINFALDMHAVFDKHRGVPSLFSLFNVHKIFVLTFKSSFLSFVYGSRSTKVSMITLLGGPNSRRGVQIRKRIWTPGGPYPLADLDRGGSIFASGFGPGGPNPGGSKSARTPATPKKIFKASVPADFSTLQAVQSSWGQDKKPFFTGKSTTAGCRIDAPEDIFVGSNFDTR